MRIRVPKTLTKIVITIVVMVILFIGAGVAYVYFTGKSAPADGAIATAPSTEEKSPLPKPVAPSPNAPEGVAVGTLSTPVKIGENASISVATNAGSQCTIVVTYGGVVSKDSGLGPKKADVYGNATWTWTVGSTVPVGNGQIKVTCVYNGRSGVVETTQVVIK